jgi:hypothetical protein
MSSTSIVLPHLYHVQSTLEDYYNKYGNTVQFNPSAAVAGIGSPSKQQVLDFYSSLAKGFVNVQKTKNVVNGTNKTKSYDAKIYFVLIELILFSLLGIAVLYWYIVYKNNPKFIKKIYTEKPVQFLLTASFILFIFLCMSLTFRTFRTWMGVYDKIYNTDSVGINADQCIRKAMDMMYYDDEGRRKFKSTNPMVVYAHAMHVPLDKGITIVTNDCCCADVTSNAPKGPSDNVSQANVFGGKNNKVLKYSPDDFFIKCNKNLNNKDVKYNQYVYPFDGNDSINPFKLKREIQRLDLYGQIQRIKSAVDYMKVFLIRENDTVFANGASLSPQSCKTIVDGVCEILKVNASEVTNIRLNKLSDASLSKLSKDACYSACISDDNCALASFESNNNSCALVSKDQLKNVEPVYTSTVGVPVLVKELGSSFPLYGESLNIEYVNTNFRDIPTACSNAGCITHNSSLSLQGKMANNPIGIDLKKVFNPVIEGTGTSLGLTYYTSTDQVFSNGTYDKVLKESKEHFVNKCKEFIKSADVSNTFELNTEYQDQILEKLKTHYGTGYGNVSPILTEIFSMCQKGLDADRISEKTILDVDPKKKKYIPYERFVEKCREQSSHDFVIKFVYNCEELRASSDGLHNIFDNYYVGDEFNDHSKTCYTLVIYMFGAVVGLCIIAYTVHYLKKNGFIRDESTGQKYKLKVAKPENFNEAIMYSSGKVDDVMRFVIIIVVYIVSIFMYYGYKNKTHKVYEFNKMVFTTNGSMLKDNANIVLESLYQDFKNLSYTIAKSPVKGQSYKGILEIKNGEVLFNPEFNPTGIPDNNEKFDYIVMSSVIDNNTRFDYTGPNNLDTIYNKLVDAIEVFEKCNSLFMVKDMGIPIPIVELSIYVIIMAVSLLVLFFIVRQFRPYMNFFKLLENYGHLKHLKGNMNVQARDISIPSAKQLSDNKVANELVLKIAGIVIILGLGVGYCKLVSENITNFDSGLYSSHLFRNSECYGL